MIKREFLQLAHNKEHYPNQNLGGWLVSEKLDGQRAWWDGGVTRGLWADVVPWANVAKDERLLNKPVATGLWSRYGKVIHAPDAWLDKLPFMSLDGELYLGAGRHQELRSAVSKHIPVASEWENVDFMVFDSPSPAMVLCEGEIKNPNFLKIITTDMLVWFLNRYNKMARPSDLKYSCEHSSPFRSRYEGYRQRIPADSWAKAHHQVYLPYAGWQEALDAKLDEVLVTGGEGLIVRDPDSLWYPKRIKGCLKIKPGLDSEATVIYYTWGRETDKGSKLLGKMGALGVRWTNNHGKEVEFELSGFTDAERILVDPDDPQGYFSKTNSYFYENAGKPCESHWTNPLFPIGTKVTFMYRELTDAGVPKESRFLRVRSDE